MCRFIDVLLEKKTEQRIFNVGNKETVSIKEWVKACYQVVGKELYTVKVDASHPQRQFFCFHDYEYYLDVTKQERLMPNTKSLYDGLQESYAWHLEHEDLVNKKPLLEYIEKEIAGKTE